MMPCSYAAPWQSDALQDESGTFKDAGQDLAVWETAADYRPRNPAESILYRVIAAELDYFLERQRLRDRHVPRFVERELHSFLEVLTCPRCGARMRILAAINSPDAIRKILACLGLPARNPPIGPAILDTDAPDFC